VCSLCLETVPAEVWNSGEHRSQCSSRNTAKLSTFPAHSSISCSICQSRLRQWPDVGPKFMCSSQPGCCPAGSGARLSPAHQNKYSCFICDYNLCKLCIQNIEEEQRKKEEESKRQEENSRHLVTCLKSMCDRLKEKVAEESKQKKQDSFDSSVSILLDTQDIPLMDELTPTEEIPVRLTVSRIRSDSCTENSGEKVPCRRSVVSCNPRSYEPIPNSLPKKPLAILSPDVFHLRAPLVSWENFMTPAGSAETFSDNSDGTKLERWK